LGGDNGAGFGWRDIDIYKVGVQWEKTQQDIFRVGYSHANQTIRSSQVLFNILAPAVIEDHITAGYTHVFNDKSEVSIEAMHAFHHSVEGPNPFDPTQMIRLKIKEFEVGFSWSKHFQ